MAVTRIEFEEKERAIELPGGEILDLPTRTKDINDKLDDFEKRRTSMNEYDFLKGILTVIFGESGFKTIAPEGKKSNLDYLSAVYRTSVNLIYEDKTAAQQAEFENFSERYSAIRESAGDLKPLLDTLK